MIQLLKRLLSPKKREINLKEDSILRFDKIEYDSYRISFYNPLKDAWWELPKSSAWVYGEWSFNKRPRRRGFNSCGQECRFENIHSNRYHYRTLGDIQRQFDKINREVFLKEDRWRKNNNLPNRL
jgi:hypothetical protein